MIGRGAIIYSFSLPPAAPSCGLSIIACTYYIALFVDARRGTGRCSSYEWWFEERTQPDADAAAHARLIIAEDANDYLLTRRDAKPFF